MSRLKTLLSLLTFLPILLYSQTMEFTNETGFVPSMELNNDLNPVCHDSLLSEMVYVAKVTATDSKIERMYWDMHNESTSTGANVYQLVDFDMDSLGQVFECVWDLYYCEDSIRDFNFKAINTNTVYVFGNGRSSSKFRVNGKVQTVLPQTFYSKTIEIGQTLRVNKGGLFGMTFRFNRRPDGENRYLSVGGALVGPTSMGPTVGVSITTGSFQRVDRELGAFLALIYTRPFEY